MTGKEIDTFEQELKLLRDGGLKTSPLRREYEEKVHALQALPDRLRREGKSEDQIARMMHDERRRLGRVYKEAAPPIFREYIYAATAAKYGDPLGPTYEMLRARKTSAQIIESASRPIRDLDDRLSVEGFRKWYEEKAGKADRTGHVLYLILSDQVDGRVGMSGRGKELIYQICRPDL